jgi:trimethylamine--corrinoid protein Co-methyltransferase
VDEVFSPIQMILDDEMVGALRRFARGFEVTDETLAVDLIRQVGPGGTFLDQEHTLRHFRAELWEPRLFARQMFAGWRQAGARSAEDIAMEMYRDLVRREPLPSLIPDDLDRELVRMLRRATGLDLGPVDGEGRM